MQQKTPLAKQEHRSGKITVLQFMPFLYHGVQCSGSLVQGRQQPMLSGSLPSHKHLYVLLTQKQNGSDDLPRNNCMNFHEPGVLSIPAYLRYLTPGEEA